MRQILACSLPFLFSIFNEPSNLSLSHTDHWLFCLFNFHGFWLVFYLSNEKTKKFLGLERFSIFRVRAKNRVTRWTTLEGSCVAGLSVPNEPDSLLCPYSIVERVSKVSGVFVALVLSTLRWTRTTPAKFQDPDEPRTVDRWSGCLGSADAGPFSPLNSVGQSDPRRNGRTNILESLTLTPEICFWPGFVKSSIHGGELGDERWAKFQVCEWLWVTTRKIALNYSYRLVLLPRIY